MVKVKIVEWFRDENGHLSMRTIFSNTFFNHNLENNKGDEE
jgi:hypothetical protein